MSSRGTRSTERFTNLHEDYERYRPSYPSEAVGALRAFFGLSFNTVIADVGAGTGIFTRLLLDDGFEVVAIEPNESMGRVLESSTRAYARARCVRGSAEQTGLDPCSVDLYCAAQAFHWFDVPAARREALRILRPPFRAALIWNNRSEAGPFHREYEELLRRFGVDYLTVKHSRAEADGRIEQFFGYVPAVQVFPNQQICDRAFLSGRTRSSSYVPQEGHVNYRPLMDALNDLFDRFAVDGRVTLHYETKVYLGCMAMAAERR